MKEILKFGKIGYFSELKVQALHETRQFFCAGQLDCSCWGFDSTAAIH